jgi:hypothetical protein
VVKHQDILLVGPDGLRKGSGRFLYFAGGYATGANSHPFHSAFWLDGAYFFKVWVPSTPCCVVGVTYVITKHRLLAADFTDFSH